MSTKMSDEERERLRLATASVEKLDAAAEKEESLLRKLITSLDKEGIVKFKDSTNYTLFKESLVKKSQKFSPLAHLIMRGALNVVKSETAMDKFLRESHWVIDPPILAAAPTGESPEVQLQRYQEKKFSFGEVQAFGIKDYYFANSTTGSFVIRQSLLDLTMLAVHDIVSFGIPRKVLDNPNFKDYQNQQLPLLNIVEKLKLDYTNVTATLVNFMTEVYLPSLKLNPEKGKLLDYAHSLSENVLKLHEILEHPDLKGARLESVIMHSAIVVGANTSNDYDRDAVKELRKLTAKELTPQKIIKVIEDNRDPGEKLSSQSQRKKESKSKGFTLAAADAKWDRMVLLSISEMECFCCRKKGHLVADCPEKRNGTQKWLSFKKKSKPVWRRLNIFLPRKILLIFLRKQ